MEKAITKKVRSKFLIRIQDIACAGIAVLVIGTSSPYTPAFVFLFTAYSYIRSNREAYIAVFFIMLIALSRGVVYAYFYALGLAFFFVLNHIIKLANRNIYQWIPFITALVCIPFAIKGNGFHINACIQPMLVFVFMREMTSDYSWTSTTYRLAESIYGVIIFSAGILLAQWMPAIHEEIMLLSLLLISFVCKGKTTATLIISMLLLLPIEQSIWILPIILVSLFREDKQVLCLLLLGSFLFLPKDVFGYCYCSLALIMGLSIKRDKIPLLAFASETKRDEIHLSNDNILRRQMQNYAGIFQTLAEYYSSINNTEADLLGNMASALQYHAEEIEKVEDMGKDYHRLRRALEGYQFEIEDLKIEEFKDGQIQINLEISNIRRGEIRTTLQPLLEALLHRSLEIEEIKGRRFSRGFAISLCDHIPFEIEAFGDSVKNSYTSSGDTLSIFKFRQSMICMISDGMGNGERAAQSSRLITGVFQKMMISGIPQDNAIRCINKLIQSDTFATLDVICFNRSKGVAYISKSAACPTYLLRAGKIHEISGNALPVGIIAQMKPDCFEIDIQNEDEYLMVSDGIQQSEIDQWLTYREHNSIKEDIDIFIKILQKSRRKDDSTMILVRVKEIA